MLLIGWDAADWEVIHPMMEKGLMPALQHLVENGVSGNLATLEPVFSPMLWTSIASGKRADKHGVLGFTEPDYTNGGVKPVSTFSRKTAAIWNILSHENFKCNVVGWWPSHPAEPLNGCMVSNIYQRAIKPYGKSWPMASGTVFPKKIRNVMKELRVHPGDLTESHLLPFVPDAAKIDQEKDKRLFTMAKILSEAASIHNAGTWLMENTEWDFMAIYLDNIDHFSHAFMKYHPPKMAEIKEDDYQLYRHVVEAAYRYHDMMLGRILNLTDSETSIILVSDHGFESGKNRLFGLPKEAGAPAYDHRSYGIFAAMGPEIKKDELLYGANLLDIAPTILTAFDLPLGEDMDGKPLLNIFKKEKEIKYLSSWDHFIERTVTEIKDKEAAEESMKMLIELGYVEKPDENAGKAFEKAKIENDFNLARVFLNSNRPKKAIEILKPLFDDHPSMRFGLRLAIAYEAIKHFDSGIEVLEKVEEIIKKPIQQLRVLKASLLIAGGKKEEGFELVKSMSEKRPTAPFVAQRVAESLIQLRKNKLAKKYLDMALVYFPENASLLFLKGSLLQKRKNNKEAVDHFLAAIGGQFFNPKAHFKLAKSLEEMGLKEDAYRAYSVSLQQDPKSKKSLQQLAKLESEGVEVTFRKPKTVTAATKKKGNESSNRGAKEEYLSSLKGTVYVVSGFPRSGTSMMMQMLHAAGMNIFSDKKRKADANNPEGYFEHEGIKTLARNQKLLLEAKEQLVKIVAPHLFYLIPTLRYKVIFMDRKFEEVIISQHKMSGKKIDSFPYKLLSFYQKQLTDIEKSIFKQLNVEVLRVNYQEAISSPEKVSKKVSGFLSELNLDINQMTKAIKPELYRNRLNSNSKYLP